MSVESDGLHHLQADLSKVAGLADAEVKKSMQQAAMVVKLAWQADAKSSYGRVGARFAPTIDYDENDFGSFGRHVFEVEVGSNISRYGGKTGPGGLIPSMGVLDEARGRIGGRPRDTWKRAEKAAIPVLEEKIELAVSESLRKAGL